MVLVILDCEVVDDRQRRPERDASLIGNCTLATVHAGRSEPTTNVAAPQVTNTQEIDQICKTNEVEDDVPFQAVYMPILNITTRETLHCIAQTAQKDVNRKPAVIQSTLADIPSFMMPGLLTLLTNLLSLVSDACDPRHVLSIICFFMGFLCNFDGGKIAGAKQAAKFALALAVCMTIAFAAPAEAAKLQHTNQVLNKACQAWIEQKDCPIKEQAQKDWEKLNSLCCLAYPGTVLHCQRQYDSQNEQFNIAACVEEKPTPKGHYVHLGTDKEGNPNLQVKACSDDSYEESDRLSSYVTYNYCLPKKTACYGPGVAMLCTGNLSSDNKCFCGAKFAVAGANAACASGWGKDDPCTCIPITCPDGQQLDCPLSEEQWDLPTCAALDMAKYPTCKCVNPATNTTNIPTMTPPNTTPTVVAPPTIKSDGSDSQSEFDVEEPDNGSSFICAFFILSLLIILMSYAINPFGRFKLRFKQCPPVQWEYTKL